MKTNFNPVLIGKHKFVSLEKQEFKENKFINLIAKRTIRKFKKEKTVFPNFIVNNNQIVYY